MPDAAPVSALHQLPRVLGTIGPVLVTWRRLWLGALGLVLLAALAWWGNSIDLPALHARAKLLPAWSAFGMLTLLPLVFFPVSLLHIAAGVRFGIAGGIAAVAFSTFLQITLAWLLVRLSPQLFDRLLLRWKVRLTAKSHPSLVVLSCLLPGLPYTAQLYVLPLLNVPLRLIVLIGVPIHTVRAIVSIIGGDISGRLTPTNLALLALYFVIVSGLTVVAVRRLHSSLADQGTRRRTR